MNKEEIIELVKYGCDPELIAFEFNVPIDEIKKVIDTEAKKTFLSRESKMNKIRVKYFNQYYSYDSNDGNVASMEPTPQEEKNVQEVIDYLKREQENIENMSDFNRKAILNVMLKELKILDTTNSTLEQTEEIKKMIDRDEFKNISKKRGEKGVREFYLRKRRVEKRYSQLIEEKDKKTTDIKKLIELKKKITPEMARENLLISNIKGRIENKITTINSKVMQYEMRNNVSPEIRGIVIDIAEGTINMQEAQQTILKEAHKRVEEAKKATNGRVALSEQQYERQIAIQIRTLLSEQGNDYRIKDVKNSMQVLSEFPEKIPSSQAFRVVVDNLASQEKFKQAIDLCDSNISRMTFEGGETLISQAARSKKREIALRQIGSMIKEKIENKVSDEDDQMFMSLLERRLENEKIRLDAIQIGKDSSQTKSIRLSDIWYEKNREK